MRYFIPWVILILAVIIAGPVAAKMNPGPKRKPVDADEGEVLEVDGDEAAVLDDDFGAEPVGEPLDEDAFAEFN